MNQAKYLMNGKEGELLLTVNGYVLAYAEKFAARLTETLKEMNFRDQHWTVPDSYEASIILRSLSNPDPDIVRAVVNDITDSKALDFEFRGHYKSKNGLFYPVKFCRLIPVDGDLNNYLSGYVDEWEFQITALDDKTISEFKKAY